MAPLPAGKRAEQTSMKELFKPISAFFRKLFGRQEKKPQPPKKPIPSPQELRDQVEKQKKRIQEAPYDCAAHFLLGEAYIHLKQFSNAMVPLKEAIRIDSNFMESYFLLGKACVELGRDEEAIEPLEKSLERNRQSSAIRSLLAEAHKNLCVAYGKFKRYDEAIREFNEAIKVKPNYGAVYLSVSKTYFQQGRYDETLIHLEKALKMDKNLGVEAHYQFGVVFAKLGKQTKAIKHYKEAIEINPKAALPQLNLGLIHMKSGKYKDAIKPLQAAVTYSPRLASDGWYPLGVAFFKLNRYSEAVEPLREALKVSRANEKVRNALVEALYQVGMSHGKNQRIKEQIDALGEAIDVYPDHAKSHFALGTVYDLVKKGRLAAFHMNRAKLAYGQQENTLGYSKSRRTLEFLYKKYNLNPKDFEKVGVLKK